MNRIAITGRLAADSELRFTSGGDPILNFRVADDVGYGERKSTNWWHCSIFGKRATDSLQSYLAKGQQVAVWGQVVLREWTNKDGIKQLATEIRVDEVQLMGGKTDGKPAGKPAQTRKDSGMPEDIDDSDVPF